MEIMMDSETVDNDDDKNNDDNCFRYALTAALNYQNIKSHPERVSNLKSFVKQYNRKKKWIFRQHKKTGKSLNETISQLLLISYFYHPILKK